MQKIKILMLGESLERQGGIVSVQKLILKLAPSQILISHVPTLPNASTLGKVLVFCRALVILCWRLLQKEVDIVHIHVSDRGSAFRQAITTMVAWLLQRPVILHAHSPDFHLFYSHLPHIIKAALRWTFCRSARFIVLSDSWKNFYMDNFGFKADQIVVLPNPVKIPGEIPQRISSKKVKFLFLGRIGERKGVFDLIEAFSTLLEQEKHSSELIIAGDGEVEKARNIVKNLQLERYINILNWVNEEQRDALLEKADVFVLPSYNEGMPMALLEAMSWGLPVITTPVGGIPEVVIPNHNGLLVKPGCIQDLLSAMQSLIIDRELRRRLGENARKSVKLFDAKNYLASLLDIYRSVLVSK